MSEQANLKVRITRWTDDHQPGFVECQFDDCDGRVHVFEEKTPVVSANPIFASSPFPLSGFMACEIIQRHADGSADIELDLPNCDLRVRVWQADLLVWTQ